MSGDQGPHVLSWTERLFPERHIYLRSRGETRGYVLTTRRQMALAAALCALSAWVLLASASTFFTLIMRGSTNEQVADVTARYERADADLRARYDTALARLGQSSGSLDDMARNIERRHAALTRVLMQFRGVPGAEQALAPAPLPDAKTTPPLERVLAVRSDQERLVAKAETFAHSRAERLRLAFRLAGLNPAEYGGNGSVNLGVGGPLVDANDPKALAVILDVDEEFAQRIQNASRDLSAMRSLADAADRLPLARPTTGTTQTSGFGVRIDPFNGRPAMHTGLDFAGAYFTPIHATGPGIVSFAGVRSGYGNTVEIDHGGGFKTRYGHMASIAVHVGQRVAVGERIGAMGSTGRSTGPHVHYEVWVNGRPENPIRFLKAGDYVQQN